MGNYNDPTSSPFPDPEEERAEQIEDFIEALEAERHPDPPHNLDPDDADAFAMAAFFHAASGADKPDSAFLAALEERLTASSNHHDPAATHLPIVAVPPPSHEKPARRPSRRNVLAGGLVAAASLAAGLVGGALIEHTANGDGSTSTWPNLVGEGVWQTIASVSKIAPSTITRFATTSLVGHLVRRADGSFYALSAACTHMGCLVNWNPTGDSFDCPCHNGRFKADGTTLTSQPAYRPLPAIQIRVVGDEVQAFVPASDTSGTSTPPSAPWAGH